MAAWAASLDFCTISAPPCYYFWLEWTFFAMYNLFLSSFGSKRLLNSGSPAWSCGQSSRPVQQPRPSHCPHARKSSQNPPPIRCQDVRIVNSPFFTNNSAFPSCFISTIKRVAPCGKTCLRPDSYCCTTMQCSTVTALSSRFAENSIVKPDHTSHLTATKLKYQILYKIQFVPCYSRLRRPERTTQRKTRSDLGLI